MVFGSRRGVFWYAILPVVVSFLYLALYTYLKSSDTTFLSRSAAGKYALPSFVGNPKIYNDMFLPGNHSLKMLRWGSYRPNLYFGMAALPFDSSSPNETKITDIAVAPPPITSALYYLVGSKNGWILDSIRYDCQQQPDVTYGWKLHDGKTFGIHQIIEPKLNLNVTSSFVKISTEGNINDVFDKGGHWASVIKSRFITHPHSSILESFPFAKTLLSYMDNNLKQAASLATFFMFRINDGNVVKVFRNGKNQLLLKGKSLALGDFEIRIISKQNWKIGELASELSFTAVSSPYAIVDYFKDILTQRIKSHGFTLDNTISGPSNTIILQTLTGPESDLYISFISEEACKLSPAELRNSVKLPSGTSVSCNGVGSQKDFETIQSKLVQNYKARFSSQFSKMSSYHTENVGLSVLSDLLGAVGYFYGDQIIKNSNTNSAREKGPYSLFASVPSRPFFPRGFLWDEGFHNILIQEWDLSLSSQLVKSWFSQLDENGWVAREQILGDESRNKVPSEFQVQDSSIANPPMLHMPAFIIAKKLLNPNSNSTFYSQLSYSKNEVTEYLELLFPKLLDNYNWYKNSQTTHFLENSYKKVLSNLPKEWFSGKLKNGTSVDLSKIKLFRWNGQTKTHCLASGLDDYPRNPNPTKLDAHMDLLSWMVFMTNGLIDMCSLFGESSKHCSYEILEGLKKDNSNYKYTLEVVHLDPETKLFHDVHIKDDEIIFDIHRGYIQLLPLIHGILDPTRDKSEIGELISSKKILFSYIDLLEELNTGYGLMSLSTKDEMFGTKENYWRGPIWVNFNIMTLIELSKSNNEIYINKAETSDQIRIKNFVGELHYNVVDTVTSNFIKTGFLYEQYNSSTGAGQRTRPFNGWSSLIVLLLADDY